MLLLLEARRKASDLCAQKGVSCTHHDSLPAFEEQFRTLFFSPNSIIISPLMVRNSRFRKLPLQTLGKEASLCLLWVLMLRLMADCWILSSWRITDTLRKVYSKYFLKLYDASVFLTLFEHSECLWFYVLKCQDYRPYNQFLKQIFD